MGWETYDIQLWSPSKSPTPRTEKTPRSDPLSRALSVHRVREMKMPSVLIGSEFGVGPTRSWFWVYACRCNLLCYGPQAERTANSEPPPSVLSYIWEKMSSTPKRRGNPKLDHSSSSRSSLHSLTTLEPPSSFFPSREELLKLVAVVAIASAVAVSCNFFTSVVNPQAKPFCDSDVDSAESTIDGRLPFPIFGLCQQPLLHMLHRLVLYSRMYLNSDGSVIIKIVNFNSCMLDSPRYWKWSSQLKSVSMPLWSYVFALVITSCQILVSLAQVTENAIRENWNVPEDTESKGELV